MKIAILTPTFAGFSGIDRLVEEKAKQLKKKGHKVTIVTLSSSMAIPGVSIIELGMPKNSFLERIYRLFMFVDRKKILKTAKHLASYDWVLSHLYPMNLIAKEAKKINPKLRYTYHNAGVGITEEYSFLERTYLHLFNFFTNQSIKNCDDAISISHFLRKELERQTGIKSKVEYVAIDKKKYKKLKGKRIRKKHDIKGPMLLYVGRISPHKGIHLLIDAFKEVEEVYPKAKLVIVGKHTFSKYSKELKARASSNVIFTGFVKDEDLPDYYGACDIYTTCSLWEGFDMPIVEAYYSGKPSVAFNVGSHPEVLKKGKLVEKNDVKGFSKAILKILKKTYK